MTQGDILVTLIAEGVKFLDPAVAIIIPVLAVVGMMMKKSEKVADWKIPIWLGVVGVVLATGIIFSTKGFTVNNALSALIQGILCAGTTVYGHQLQKQYTKNNRLNR